MKKTKEKWLDEEFLVEMSKVITKLTEKGAQISNTDLSGIVIDNKSPVEQLRKSYLFESKLLNVDLSYSTISGSANQSDWRKVILTKAKLDRCSINKSQIKECNFQEAKLVINADDTIFENCSFVNAKLGIGTYGYEYGGRRTKFYNCDFTDAVFRNQEFRASRFYNCNFTNTKFVNCDLRGIKIEGNKPKDEQFEKMDVPQF
ncbi:hypothetical Protein KLA_15685 [Cellulophaga geojensis KL-A]|uniref:Pentapeptide repeat-containing protein n=1 Tax=Cellulophaga geojensis KL-A TaxID=1328323 RepID=A0ABN0RK46_9FLAO|nr:MULTISPECIES: pentapeptide repeat-containing protein [Cellulophaga]EWH11452.1 hypothetical Protein KLA_15685 [Cellulophaga geojensis KL-A]